MAVHTLQVTLGAGATQFSSTPKSVRQLVIQNNGANGMRVGDSNVSATRGISLPSGGTFNSGPVVIQHAELSEWYAFGTATDKLDILYLD